MTLLNPSLAGIDQQTLYAGNPPTGTPTPATHGNTLLATAIRGGFQGPSGWGYSSPYLNQNIPTEAEVQIVPNTRRQRSDLRNSPQGGNSGTSPTIPAPQQNTGGLKGGAQGYGQNVFPYPSLNPDTTGIGIQGYQMPWSQPLYPLYGTGGTAFNMLNQLYAPWNESSLMNNAADYYYMMGTRYSPLVSPLMQNYPTGNIPAWSGFNQYSNPANLMFNYDSLIPGGAWNWMAGNTGGS